MIGPAGTTWRRGRWISATGRAGDGDAVGICIPGGITCPGVGDGDAAGICMPGVMTCGLGDGDAAGICIPGVMTCGVGDGEGLGLAVLRVVVRLGRGVLLLVVVRFGFGVAAFGLGITCPSCCGKAVLLSENTSAREQNARSIRFVTDQFIFPPSGDCNAKSPQCYSDIGNKQRATQIDTCALMQIDLWRELNAENADEYVS